MDGQTFDDFGLLFGPDEIIYTPTVAGYTEGYIYHGFGAPFEDAFLNHVAQQSRMIFVRFPEDDAADPIIVADLNLVGTATAVARLRSCAAAVIRQNAEQERREARWDYMARDPFADSDR